MLISSERNQTEHVFFGEKNAFLFENINLEVSMFTDRCFCVPFGKLELSFGVDGDLLETIPFLYI